MVPSVRLGIAPTGDTGGNNSVEHNTTLGGLGRQDNLRPALLVSYVYLEPFLKNRHRYSYRDWVLDSGAFSAHNSGTEIRLQDYIDTCKRLMDEDETLVEIYTLDVIGDWKASIKNCEKMWKQGVEAIPTYHEGEPEHALKRIAKGYPKIALGGVAHKRGSGKIKWAEQCFARVWPKKIHGFGFGSEKAVMTLPWHSVDATNWEIGPCKFGRWNQFGNLSVRGSKQNLRAEVLWYLELEKKARWRWRREMQQLTGRLAVEPGAAGGRRVVKASERERESPSIRLALQSKEVQRFDSLLTGRDKER